MLQKPERVGYNLLSRRQILKALGIIALNGLAGCANSLESEFPKESRGRFTALGAAALDQNRLRRAVQRIKPAVKALNIWRRNGQMPPGLTTKLKTARDAALDVFAHLDKAGISEEFDTQLPDTIQLRHRIDLPKEHMSLIWQELQEMGFSEQDPEVRYWRLGFELSEQEKTKLLEVLEPGISGLWEKMIQTIDQIIAKIDQFRAQPQSGVHCMRIGAATPLCGGGGSTGPGIGAYLGCGAAILSAAGVIAIAVAACGGSGPIGYLFCMELVTGSLLSSSLAALGCVAALSPG